MTSTECAEGEVNLSLGLNVVPGLYILINKTKIASSIYDFKY